jgi:hypothetical protein
MSAPHHPRQGSSKSVGENQHLCIYTLVLPLKAELGMILFLIVLAVQELTVTALRNSKMVPRTIA